MANSIISNDSFGAVRVCIAELDTVGTVTALTVTSVSIESISGSLTSSGTASYLSYTVEDAAGRMYFRGVAGAGGAPGGALVAGPGPDSVGLRFTVNKAGGTSSVASVNVYYKVRR